MNVYNVCDIPCNKEKFAYAYVGTPCNPLCRPHDDHEGDRNMSVIIIRDKHILYTCIYWPYEVI
jgi:hypothetical protein